ncbi:uncharacterized protein LOC135464051 [Liolophura sinensis]|uniref:uncharacterized protein LOC135464051 n=1 Tax=Liolophura sinensis TaxID=3198878 RepID=UPI003158EB46
MAPSKDKKSKNKEKLHEKRDESDPGLDIDDTTTTTTTGETTTTHGSNVGDITRQDAIQLGIIAFYDHGGQLGTVHAGRLPDTIAYSSLKNTQPVCLSGITSSFNQNPNKMDYRRDSQMPTSPRVRWMVRLMCVLSVGWLLLWYGLCIGPACRPSMPEEAIQDDRTGRQYLVYDCSSAPCGGWADRLEGITSTYLIALATGRSFHINITYPIDIRGFLQQNEVNWEIDQLKLLNKSTRFYSYMDNRNFCRSLTNIDFDHNHPEDVVRLRMNAIGSYYLNQNTKYKQQLLPFLNKSLASTFSTIHRRLFRFSEELNTRLSAFMNIKLNQGKNLVCVQIRIGSAVEKRSYVSISDLKPFWEFIKTRITQDGDVRIFVATDSEAVVKESLRRFGWRVLTVEGHADHIDKSDRKDVAGGFWKTLTDFYALEMCDTLVLSIWSSFGRLPAFLRGRDDGLYVFQNHQIQRTSLKDIEDEYLQRVVL